MLLFYFLISFRTKRSRHPSVNRKTILKNKNYLRIIFYSCIYVGNIEAVYCRWATFNWAKLIAIDALNLFDFFHTHEVKCGCISVISNKIFSTFIMKESVMVHLMSIAWKLTFRILALNKRNLSFPANFERSSTFVSLYTEFISIVREQSAPFLTLLYNQNEN